MKIARVFLQLAFTFSLWNASAQILQPVHWTTEVKQLDKSHYEIILKAKMDEGWAIYSQSSDPNAAQPIEITLVKDKHFELIGKVEERGKKKEGPEPLFDNLVVSKYYDHVDFVQKINVSDASKPIKASAYFMSCNSEKCIPPTNEDFVIALNGEVPEEKSMGGMPAGSGLIPSSTLAGIDQNSNLLDPVKVKSELIDKGNAVYGLKFTAIIQDGWYIYSHNIPPDGPIPSDIVLTDDSGYEKMGSIQELSDHRLEGFDEIF
ncbi:MAG: hypothetical protein IPG95_07615 [Saprospiraceae bacterium]|nr:hypothetical protein [Saprospiraceae bacterium]